MALTETRPDTDEPALTSVSAEPASPVDGILGTGDHKTIGRLWIGFGLLSLAGGLVFALLAAVELVDLSSFGIAEDADQLTQLWSLGRDMLLFGGIVPLLVGLATYIVPLQVGASSIAFARGAAAAFWTWFVATDILVLAYIMNGGPAGGRTDFVLLWTLALGVMVASILWALICVATTVLGARAAGMTLDRVPYSTWSFFVFAVGSLLALPVMLAELTLAYLDVKYGFLPTKADRTLLVAIADSVYLTPAIYWLAVPTLGMALDVIGVHTGRPVRQHRMLLAMLSFYGFVAYGADMLSFAWRGRPIDYDNALLLLAILAAVLPVLVILSAGGDSVAKGKPSGSTPLMAVLLAGLLLLLASVAALLGLVDPYLGFIESLSGEEIDYSLDLFGTSFHEGVRALVLGGVILGLIGAIHHWAHKIWGRSLDGRVGFVTVLVAAAGSVMWGTTKIVAGFLDQPRLPLQASDPENGVEFLNFIGAAGIGLLVLAGVLLLLNAVAAMLGRAGSAAEPWRGVTLEWATTSPPSYSNFTQVPVVTSATPLADLIDDEGVER